MNTTFQPNQCSAGLLPSPVPGTHREFPRFSSTSTQLREPIMQATRLCLILATTIFVAGSAIAQTGGGTSGGGTAGSTSGAAGAAATGGATAPGGTAATTGPTAPSSPTQVTGSQTAPVPGQSSPLPPQLQNLGSPSTAVTGATQPASRGTSTSGCASRSAGSDMPSSTPGITGSTTTGGTPRITTDVTAGTSQPAQNGSVGKSGNVAGC